jgi:hypothetical protein
MTIFEETDEFAFVQHAISILGVPNTRPDLAPGGLWIRGKLRLSWGLRTATEPPTIQLGSSSACLNGNIAFLPYDLPGRLAVWRTTMANRENSHYPELSSLDFRDTVALTAILAWNPPDPSHDDH